MLVVTVLIYNFGSNHFLSINIDLESESEGRNNLRKEKYVYLVSSSFHYGVGNSALMSNANKKIKIMTQYMVEIKFEKRDIPEIMPLVPEQQKRIDELMQKNKVSSYVLSLERAKLWMIVNENDEHAVMDLLETLPIYEWIEFDLYGLTFNNQVVGMPAISLN